MKMKIRKRWFFIFFLSLYFIFIALRAVFLRRNEINNFFPDRDLLWAKMYLDKKINFCELNWPNSIAIMKGGHLIRFSPSKEYRVEKVKIGEGEFDFGSMIFDNVKNRALLQIPDYPGYDMIKWVRDERYFVYMETISTEIEFTVPGVYIGNPRTGQLLYFFDSTIADCPLSQ